MTTTAAQLRQQAAALEGKTDHFSRKERLRLIDRARVMESGTAASPSPKRNSGTWNGPDANQARLRALEARRKKRDDAKERALALVRSGASAATAAAQVGYSADLVRGWCKEAGITPPHGKPGPKPAAPPTCRCSAKTMAALMLLRDPELSAEDKVRLAGGLLADAEQVRQATGRVKS